MKKFRADLHVHTVLSPCADLEMSPDLIVRRALDHGLDIIAVTDHNSTRQCSIVKKMAEDSGLLVVNGSEVNSSEEVHALCLFEDDYSRDQFQKFLDKNLPNIPNHPGYFGHQVIVNEKNEILEEVEEYLGSALSVGLETIEKQVHQLNGLFIPAHIDRPINSIFSQLGFIPPYLKVDAMQITSHASEKQVRQQYDLHEERSLIKCSDAHYPEDLGNTYTTFHMHKLSFQELKWALLQKNGRKVSIDL